MNYILEKTSPEVLQKISSDSQSDPWQSRMLLRHLRAESMHTWAVDRENDSYLFYGPRVGEPGYSEYTFYFGGNFYHLRIKSHFTGYVEYMHPQQGPESGTSGVQDAIRSAFQVFGKYGIESAGAAPTPLAVTFQEN